MHFDAVSGRYRRDDVRFGQFDYWFAFRHPTTWVFLDFARANGAMYLDEDRGRVGYLVVDGAIAAEQVGASPGNQAPTSMVERGWPAWEKAPDQVEQRVIEERVIELLRWEEGDRWAEVGYDVATGLAVRIASPTETQRLTDLSFDREVDASLFALPARRIEAWRGGPAYVVEDMDGLGRFSPSWQPESGPGGLYFNGPLDASLDDALAWARARTDRILLRRTNDRSYTQL